MSKVQKTVRSYIIGFILSIILTFAAYIPVVIHKDSEHIILAHELLIPLVLTLAVIQLFVQLSFFLHLGNESKPRWNLLFFISTISIILLVVVGSIWIMNNLNYHMTPHQMKNYLIEKEGIHSHRD